jgi:hypothetical protein
MLSEFIDLVIVKTGSHVLTLVTHLRQQQKFMIGSASTILAIAIINPGFAQEHLLPTEIPGGDCVAANVSTAKTAAHRKIDLQYCTRNNAGDPQKIQICKQNLANQERVTFFTDRCSNNDYFIGINGVEYKLKRKSRESSRPPYLTGSFAENGIQVKVEKIRSINQVNNDGVESGELEVFVTITQNKKVKKVKGILSYGP